MELTMQERIEAKLRAAFSPVEIDVVDESDQHRGHVGWREGGETHFHVRLVSERFAGQSRVAMQRAVNRCLDEELKTSVHALSMALSAPGE